MNRGWWAESVLCLLLALSLAAGARALVSRGQDGLERYHLDQLAGRAAVTPASMTAAYCRELVVVVPLAARPESCAAPAAVATPQHSPAAVMDAFAERLNLRHRSLEGALAALAQSGIDWRVVSEGYALEPDDATLKARLRRAWAEFDRIGEEAQEFGQLSRRFDRSALGSAVAAEREAYSRAAQRADWQAAGAALLRWASLLDGKGDASAARTVAYMLDAPRIGERARQAQALVRHGALLWLGWAGWLWLAAQIGRRQVRPLPTLALLLALALALAAAEQHWLDVRLPEAAYWAGGALAGLALLLDRWAAVRGWSWAEALPRRAAASPWLLPGWLLFVGIGWLLLADLSLHFHPRLRFLLVEHFAGLWAALLLLGLMPLFAGHAIGVLARLLGRAAAPTRAGRAFGLALLLLVPAAAWLATSEAARLPQHHTGEAFKAIAVLYAAWFLLLRAPLLRGGALGLAGSVNALLPGGLALLAVATALWMTEDLGPLLVLLLCVLIWGGAFLGLPLMVTAFAAAFAALFLAAGLLSPTVAERVRSVLDPFSSKTDDLARLLWFQQEVPLAGFGLGKVPWCGYAAQERCLGLPLQTQSDYTFTALMGQYGAGAWIVVALIGLWAIALMRSRWETPVDPCSLVSGPRALSEGLRAWLAVTFGTLVAVQLAGTVAGNLGWIPLSGMTLPYVSYGSSALLTMTGFLALLADKVAAERETRHA